MLDNYPDLFHRKIGLRCQPGLVEGEICDTLHHFRVRVHHDDTRVKQIESEAIRYPWDTCPAADAKLQDLVGMPLQQHSAAIGQFAKATEHCTHAFDMVGLMVAHAAHARPPWEYYCQVCDTGPQRQRATLSLNGQQSLDWHINNGKIEAPALYAGVELQDRFISWAGQNLEPAQLDAALVLRRAWTIAPARFVDLTDFPTAASLAIPAHCFTLQPQRAENAIPLKNMVVDHQGQEDSMLTM